MESEWHGLNINLMSSSASLTLWRYKKSSNLSCRVLVQFFLSPATLPRALTNCIEQFIFRDFSFFSAIIGDVIQSPATCSICDAD